MKPSRYTPAIGIRTECGFVPPPLLQPRTLQAALAACASDDSLWASRGGSTLLSTSPSPAQPSQMMRVAHAAAPLRWRQRPPSQSHYSLPATHSQPHIHPSIIHHPVHHPHHLLPLGSITLSSLSSSRPAAAAPGQQHSSHTQHKHKVSKAHCRASNTALFPVFPRTLHPLPRFIQRNTLVLRTVSHLAM